MSKKAFKMNVGILYKSKLITLEENGIRLMEVAPEAPKASEMKIESNIDEVAPD